MTATVKQTLPFTGAVFGSGSTARTMRSRQFISVPVLTFRYQRSIFDKTN